MHIIYSSGYVLDEPFINSEIALILHVYYMDIGKEILEKVSEVQNYFGGIIITHSLDDKQFESLVKDLTPEMKNKVIPFYADNRYRDSGPFVQALRELDLSCYKVFLKLHTKKSPHLDYAQAEIWRTSLVDKLLAKESIHFAATILKNRKNPSWACSSEWVSSKNQWGLNGFWVWWITKELELDYHPKSEFPVGNMYWFNAEFAKYLKKVPIPKILTPGEENWTDGTWAHAVERIPGQISASAGNFYSLKANNGVTSNTNI